MNLIESRQNDRILMIKKLQKDRSYRSDTGLVWIEGCHLITEALQSGCKFHSSYQKEKILENDELSQIINTLSQKFVTTYSVSEKVGREIFETQTPQGIGALIYKPIDLELNEEKPVLIIDGIQDPGNLGTLIRSAEAAGVKNVILLKGTVDVWSGKVIRSTMGSVFRMKIVEGAPIEILETLQIKGYQLIGTSLQGALAYKKINISNKSALILGNEGRGIRPEILEKLDTKAYIPMDGVVESLNVAVAGSILMFYFYGRDC